MPSRKKQVQEVEETHIEEPQSDPVRPLVADRLSNEKPKRTRVMTDEMLEKLKKARELAIKAKKEKAQIDSQHKEIKEKFGDKVNQVETFEKLKREAKEKADEEVKKHEIVAINEKLEQLYGKFDNYLQEKTIRRQQKEQAKQQKKANQIVKELPAAVSKNMLEEQLKQLEIERWKRQYLGL